MNLITGIPALYLSPFVMAGLILLIHKLMPRYTHWIAAIYSLGLFFILSGFSFDIFSGATFSESQPWVPNLNIEFSFLMDGLSLLFSLMITGIGAAVFLYSGPYFSEKQDFGRYCSFLLLFMGGMLGLVLAGDLISLFVFWEITSISSFFLIGFNHKKKKAREAAIQALLVTSGAGLAMMAGLLLLGQVIGSYQFTDFLSASETIKHHWLYTSILTLIFVGAAAKSAQFPFQFWLPNAMEAPTPVSAYLHSATMVKAGVYVLARLAPTLSGTLIWTWMLGGVGFATMITAGFCVLAQKDLKLILAYLTILVLGLLVFLLGLGSETAIKAALIYLLAHSLYKAALFMMAGLIDHATGTRDVTKLGGLGRSLKFTSLTALLAGASVVGLPPFLGFVGKEEIFKALHSHGFVTGAVVLLFAIMIGMGLIVCLKPFFFHPPTHRNLHSPSFSFWAPALTLAALGFASGALVSLWAPQMIGSAADAVLQKSVKADIKVWHGLTWELFLGLASMAIGLVIFFNFQKLRAADSRLQNRFARVSPESWYTRSIELLNLIASKQTNLLQSGNLRYYVATLLGFTAIGLTLLLAPHWPPKMPDGWQSTAVNEWTTLLLIACGALSAVIAKSMLVAIVSMGASGYGITLLFALFSMPDLALTQFLVETMVVILVALVFIHLPGHIEKTRGHLSQIFDIMVSLLLGVSLTFTLWMVLARPFPDQVVKYYTTNSLTEAKGRNIVNVILTDFRALDTLGEVTVVFLAGLGVVSLIKLRPRRKESQ